MFNRLLGPFTVLAGNLVLDELGHGPAQLYAHDGGNAHARAVFQGLKLVVAHDGLTENILALKRNICLFDRLHALRSCNVGEASIGQVLVEDGGEDASIRDHDGCLDMLVHGIATIDT